MSDASVATTSLMPASIARRSASMPAPVFADTATAG